MTTTPGTIIEFNIIMKRFNIKIDIDDFNMILLYAKVKQYKEMYSILKKNTKLVEKIVKINNDILIDIIINNDEYCKYINFNNICYNKEQLNTFIKSLSKLLLLNKNIILAEYKLDNIYILLSNSNYSKIMDSELLFKTFDGNINNDYIIFICKVMLNMFNSGEEFICKFKCDCKSCILIYKYITSNKPNVNDIALKPNIAEYTLSILSDNNKFNDMKTLLNCNIINFSLMDLLFVYYDKIKIKKSYDDITIITKYNRDGYILLGFYTYANIDSGINVNECYGKIYNYLETTTSEQNFIDILYYFKDSFIECSKSLYNFILLCACDSIIVEFLIVHASKEKLVEILSYSKNMFGYNFHYLKLIGILFIYYERAPYLENIYDNNELLTMMIDHLVTSVDYIKQCITLKKSKIFLSSNYEFDYKFIKLFMNRLLEKKLYKLLRYFLLDIFGKYHKFKSSKFKNIIIDVVSNNIINDYNIIYILSIENLYVIPIKSSLIINNSNLCTICQIEDSFDSIRIGCECLGVACRACFNKWCIVTNNDNYNSKICFYCGIRLNLTTIVAYTVPHIAFIDTIITA